jgi:hypothetical protein
LRPGARGAGEVVVFAAVDNALLAAHAFPETTISLQWRKQADLANSFVGPGSHPTGVAEGQLQEGVVAWSGQAGAPELHLARTVLPAPPPGELLAVVIAGVAVGSARSSGWCWVAGPAITCAASRRCPRPPRSSRAALATTRRCRPGSTRRSMAPARNCTTSVSG